MSYMALVRQQAEPTKGKNCLFCGKELEKEGFYFCSEKGAIVDFCVYSWLLKNKDTLLEWITE